jgi:serine protease inhibitor ecotin
MNKNIILLASLCLLAVNSWATLADASKRRIEKIFPRDVSTNVLDKSAILNSMHETAKNFNVHLIQSKHLMQNDNQNFSIVSNAMKAKHDTAKNCISNVR